MVQGELEMKSEVATIFPVPIMIFDLKGHKDNDKLLEIIKKELGAPAKVLFDEFPDSPIASASLGQVYKAKINNSYLAVKVQRPNLYFLIRRDIVILRFLGTFLSPLLP